MNKLFSMWNRNRWGLMIIAFAIVLFIIIVHVLNGIIKEENTNKNVTQLTDIEKRLPTESILGGQTTSVEETKENVNEIEKFIELCNNGQVTDAYNMLTDGCKEAFFPNVETFKTQYYDKIFTQKRVGDIQSFNKNGKVHTYLVTFAEDILSTGKAENVDYFKDYITIDKTGSEPKISLRSLISSGQVNKESEFEGIKVVVVSKEIYKDIEKYKIRVENNTDKRISINTRTKSQSVYLVGSNGVAYNSNIGEVSSPLYEIPSGIKREYNLSFYKLNSSGIRTDHIVLDDIIPDYEAYKTSTNKSQEQRIRIIVDM